MKFFAMTLQVPVAALRPSVVLLVSHFCATVDPVSRLSRTRNIPAIGTSTAITFTKSRSTLAPYLPAPPLVITWCFVNHPRSNIGGTHCPSVIRRAPWYPRCSLLRVVSPPG